MSNKAHQFFEEHKTNSQKVQKLFPEAHLGFSSLFSKVMKDGSLSLKEKELIIVGISVTIRCEPCIRIHVKKALEAGAKPEQILEAASVAVVMGGGPATTYLPIVIDTLEALQGQQ
jgi:AhpD family alkylhydroperoxidase